MIANAQQIAAAQQALLDAWTAGLRGDAKTMADLDRDACLLCLELARLAKPVELKVGHRV